ncbi:hypothetical protein Ciccas_010864 [Cichlidogyrus casuarinus]|uniref:SAMD1-like winged helix (WH) domain-containing protein n=1 Tax=Cichlidogyrus casuarinus TaxID=1844966 RepID=A0ABD2PTH6_9PLAT
MLSNFVALNGIVPSNSQNISSNQGGPVLGVPSSSISNNSTAQPTFLTQPFITSGTGPSFGHHGPQPFTTTFSPPLQPGLLPFVGNFVSSNAAVSSHLSNTIIPHGTVSVAGQQNAPHTLLFTSPGGSNFITPLNLSTQASTMPNTVAISSFTTAPKTVLPAVQPVPKPLTQSSVPEKTLKKAMQKLPNLVKEAFNRPESPNSKQTRSPTPMDPGSPSSDQDLELSKIEEPLNMKSNPVNIPSSVEEIGDFSPENLEKEEYFKNYVLECIDKLKERKARPDLDRIACLMKRLHNIPLTVTTTCLEYLAEAGAVVCVDYKGHVSYRNPGKWRRTSVTFGVANGNSVSRKLMDAVNHLLDERSKQGLDSKAGVPYNDIERIVLKNEGFDFPSSEWKGNPELEEQRRVVLDKFPPTLRLCIEREVMTGGLARTPEGNYMVDESADKKRAFANILFNKKSPRPFHRIVSHSSKPISNHQSEKAAAPKAPMAKQVNIAPSMSAVKPSMPLNLPSNPLFNKRGRPPTFKKVGCFFVRRSGR